MKISRRARILSALAVLPLFPAAGEEISFDAAAGAISPPFVIQNGCVYQTNQTALTNSGRAAYTFSIAAPGEYAVRAEVCAPNEASNSFYVNMDGDPKHPDMLWEVPVATNFCQRYVVWREGASLPEPGSQRKSFKLTPGIHQLVIRGCEPNTKLVRLGIEKLPEPPPQPPAPPTNLHVVGSQ